jgi:hypothetical protein
MCDSGHIHHCAQGEWYLIPSCLRIKEHSSTNYAVNLADEDDTTDTETDTDTDTESDSGSEDGIDNGTRHTKETEETLDVYETGVAN